MAELLTCCRLTKQVGGNTASVREAMADTNLPDSRALADRFSRSGSPTWWFFG